MCREVLFGARPMCSSPLRLEQVIQRLSRPRGSKRKVVAEGAQRADQPEGDAVLLQARHSRFRARDPLQTPAGVHRLRTSRGAGTSSSVYWPAREMVDEDA
jgi:hypothetical protein